MLDNLLEIEVAYSLLKQEEGEETMDPIDYHYKQLKTHIEVSGMKTRAVQYIACVYADALLSNTGDKSSVFYYDA